MKTPNFWIISEDAPDSRKAFEALQDKAISSDGTDHNLEAILRSTLGKKVKTYPNPNQRANKNAMDFVHGFKVPDDQTDIAFCIDLGVSAYYKVTPKDENSKLGVRQYTGYFISDDNGVVCKPLHKYGFFKTITEAEVAKEELRKKNIKNLRTIQLVLQIPRDHFDENNVLVKIPATLTPPLDAITVKKTTKCYSRPRQAVPKLTPKEIANNVYVEEWHRYLFFGVTE